MEMLIVNFFAYNCSLVTKLFFLKAIFQKHRVASYATEEFWQTLTTHHVSRKLNNTYNIGSYDISNHIKLNQTLTARS